jgi:hypothetical protein
MNKVKYSSYTADFKLKVTECAETAATEQPARNLLSWNSKYTTGGSRKMLCYKLQTNPGKHFRG